MICELALNPYVSLQVKVTNNLKYGLKRPVSRFTCKETLLSPQRSGGRAVFQVYPESPKQMELITGWYASFECVVYVYVKYTKIHGKMFRSLHFTVTFVLSMFRIHLSLLALVKL